MRRSAVPMVSPMGRVWALGLAFLMSAPAASLAGDTPDKPEKQPGTVYTFYGLLKLEQDPKVDDAEKLREWQAFIKRSEEQVGYAKKAITRWKNAAKIRLVDEARAADGDPKITPEDKVTKWARVAELYPKTTEARRANKRMNHWVQVETKRRVADAERVEKSRRPKVERIKAWKQVLVWRPRTPAARAADRRIRQLARQLFAEAESVDAIARVDDETKLAAWQDVLSGEPLAKEERQARSRIKKLSAAIEERSKLEASRER